MISEPGLGGVSRTHSCYLCSLSQWRVLLFERPDQLLTYKVLTHYLHDLWTRFGWSVSNTLMLSLFTKPVKGAAVWKAWSTSHIRSPNKLPAWSLNQVWVERLKHRQLMRTVVLRKDIHDFIFGLWATSRLPICWFIICFFSQHAGDWNQGINPQQIALIISPNPTQWNSIFFDCAQTWSINHIWTWTADKEYKWKWSL